MQTREERDTMGVIEVSMLLVGRVNAALVAEFQEIKFHKDLNAYIFARILILDL
jgi:hypothetical protein